MKLYILLARMGASARELAEVPHRWWPYKTFATLRGDAALDDLKCSGQSTCCLDRYTAGFLDYYGAAVG
eukprot:9053621-Pyramimonas_sp.AAC.1